MSQRLAQLGSALTSSLIRFMFQLLSLQRQHIGHGFALRTLFHFQ